MEFRHNIQAGMVVMFITDKLVFADWIFDGHGADTNSFKRQIQHVQNQFKQGKYIVDGFKFESLAEKASSARRTAWGGEIYQGVKSIKSSSDSDMFFKLKRESFHTNKALIR